MLWTCFSEGPHCDNSAITHLCEDTQLLCTWQRSYEHLMNSSEHLMNSYEHIMNSYEHLMNSYEHIMLLTHLTEHALWTREYYLVKLCVFTQVMCRYVCRHQLCVDMCVDTSVMCRYVCWHISSVWICRFSIICIFVYVPPWWVISVYLFKTVSFKGVVANDSTTTGAEIGAFEWL